MREKYIFITGPGRCGTNLLLSLLDGNKNLNIFPGEVTNFFKDSILKNSLTKKIYSFNIDYFLKLFLKQVKKEFLISKSIKSVRKKIKKEIKKKKSIELKLFLDILIKQIFNNNKPTVINIQDEDILELLNYFPNCKVIHMIRNPFYQINSRYNFRYKKPNNYNGFEFENSFYRNYNSFKNAYLNLNNKRVKIVKLEDLVTKSTNEIKKIFKFLKIKIESNNYFPTLFGKKTDIKNLYNDNLTNDYFSKKKVNHDISNLLPNDLFLISQLKFAKHFYVIKKYNYKKNNFLLFFLRHLGFIGKRRNLNYNPIKIIKLAIYSVYLYFLDCYFKEQYKKMIK